jgi:hypothetical protein
MFDVVAPVAEEASNQQMLLAGAHALFGTDA